MLEVLAAVALLVPAFAFGAWAAWRLLERERVLTNVVYAFCMLALIGVLAVLLFSEEHVRTAIFTGATLLGAMLGSLPPALGRTPRRKVVELASF